MGVCQQTKTRVSVEESDLVQLRGQARGKGQGGGNSPADIAGKPSSMGISSHTVEEMMRGPAQDRILVTRNKLSGRGEVTGVQRETTVSPWGCVAKQENIFEKS